MTTSDGHHAGSVDGFVVDDTEHITHVVLQHGHLWGTREIAIPTGLVARVGDDAEARARALVRGSPDRQRHRRLAFRRAGYVERESTGRIDMPLHIREGQAVMTADGDHIGDVEKLVIDPATMEITHLVIEKGIFFTEDTLVPTGMVASTTDDEVTLAAKADVANLPSFEETQYVSIEPPTVGSDPTAPFDRVLFPYPPVIPSYRSITSWDWRPHPRTAKVAQRRIPEGTIVIDAGSDVLDASGDKFGTIDEILGLPDSSQATHIVVTSGIIDKERRAIPVEWIEDASEDTVRLDVPRDVAAQVPVLR